MRLVTTACRALVFALAPARAVALVVGVALSAGIGVACNPRVFAGDPSTTGDGPGVNRATSSRVDNVPYCQGGQRDTDCLFGANCRVTDAGCQVCQCLSPP